MDKSGLTYGETKLIFPILLFIVLIIFQAIMFDVLSRNISKQIIDSQSSVMQYALQSYSESAPKISVETLSEIVLHNTDIPIAAMKIISPDNDIVFEEFYIDSLKEIDHLYTKSYSVGVQQFFLIVCSYDLDVIPDNIKSLIRLMFVIISLIGLVIILLFGIILFTNSKKSAPNSENVINKNKLINVYNKEDFKDNILREALRMKRTGGNLSVVAIAIDDFDDPNIASSELSDMIYDSSVELIIENVRLFDMLGKFEGDSTIYVCMIDANEDETYNIAQRFAHSIEESKFYLNGHKEITATICSGIACLSIAKSAVQPKEIDLSQIDSLINNACKALRTGQIKGHNIITKYSSIS